jgi:hypothetical protein
VIGGGAHAPRVLAIAPAALAGLSNNTLSLAILRREEKYPSLFVEAAVPAARRFAQAARLPPQHNRISSSFTRAKIFQNLLGFCQGREKTEAYSHFSQVHRNRGVQIRCQR